MPQIYDSATHVYDSLLHLFENDRGRKFVAGVLVLVFLAALLVIDLEIRGLLPESLSRFVPDNHFYAVDLAFTFVLIIELLDLVFTLPCSVSRALGKQLEILSLILLRGAFKQLTHFGEPIIIGEHVNELIGLGASGLGALAIFVLLGVYHRVYPRRRLISKSYDRYRFIATKKIVALLLLGYLVVSGVMHVLTFFMGGHPGDFFVTFYTVLIFADILIVLISQRYYPSYHGIFRNSGYALATLIMRLALSAGPVLGAVLGVAAAGFAVVLTLAYRFYLDNAKTKAPPARPAAD
jgi:hypothetical protein